MEAENWRKSFELSGLSEGRKQAKNWNYCKLQNIVKICSKIIGVKQRDLWEEQAKWILGQPLNAPTSWVFALAFRMYLFGKGIVSPTLSYPLSLNCWILMGVCLISNLDPSEMENILFVMDQCSVSIYSCLNSWVIVIFCNVLLCGLSQINCPLGLLQFSEFD